MNFHKIILLSGALALCSTALAQQNQTEPTRIRIGDNIISLQSPLKVQSADLDSTKADINITYRTPTRTPKKYPRRSEQIYIGFGFAVPTRESDYQPIHSGNSFNLEVGKRYLYHPSKNYAIGTFLQYSCYSYRLKDASPSFIGSRPEGNYREFFRTDNIGTGLIQRVQLSNRTSAEAIVYGDYAYSKRFIVKGHVDGKKVKDKYRDGTKFNPFGAGAQAGIKYQGTTLYARYRFTNFFNPDHITPEVPRFSIGLCFSL